MRISRLTRITKKGLSLMLTLNILGQGAAGLFFGTEKHGPDEPYTGVAVLGNRRGCYEFGTVKGGYGYWRTCFYGRDHVMKPVGEKQNTPLEDTFT